MIEYVNRLQLKLKELELEGYGEIVPESERDYNIGFYNGLLYALKVCNRKPPEQYYYHVDGQGD